MSATDYIPRVVIATTLLCCASVLRAQSSAWPVKKFVLPPLYRARARVRRVSYCCRRSSSLVIALVIAAACNSTEPDAERSLAFLGDSGIPIDITVPDTVMRNTLFSVAIAYYGSSSCTRLDHVAVERNVGSVTLRPYVTRPRTGNCTDDLRRFTVPVSLMLFEPGQAEIKVLGRYETRDTTVIRTTFVR